MVGRFGSPSSSHFAFRGRAARCLASRVAPRRPEVTTTSTTRTAVALIG